MKVSFSNEKKFILFVAFVVCIAALLLYKVYTSKTYEGIARNSSGYIELPYDVSERLQSKETATCYEGYEYTVFFARETTVLVPRLKDGKQVNCK